MEGGGGTPKPQTSRLPRGDRRKGVNHYAVYTEETPASPRRAHARENPAMAATILLSHSVFFMASNITLGEGDGGGGMVVIFLLA